MSMGTTKSGRYIPLVAGVQRNRLTFLREVGKDKRGLYLVSCRCSCGTKVVIRKSEFKEAGGTKSCGCAQKEAAATFGRSKRGELGASNRWTVFKRYQRFAQARGLTFELSLEQFSELAGKPCFYCGGLPANREAAPKHYGEFVYNGLDRMNNLFGYTAKNTVACCIQCNKAKGTLSVVEFKAWLKRAFNHLFR